MELPRSIEQSIRKYESVKVDELVLAPVKVREYDEFLMARPALEVLQQSFPVRLMRVPLLAALYQMDYEAANAGKTPTGLFLRSLLALALALGIGEGRTPDVRVGLFRLAVERGRPERLLRVSCRDAAGETKEITPSQYQGLRPIIAAQNGVKLESDLANPDIVRAQKRMAEAGGPQLEVTTADLIAAVAALSGAEEAEIDEWPILKLQKRADSYRRILDYVVCGVGEMSGTTWKGGNPTPHPFFKRRSAGDGLSLFGATGGQPPAAPKAARDIVEQHKNLLQGVNIQHD